MDMTVNLEDVFNFRIDNHGMTGAWASELLRSFAKLSVDTYKTIGVSTKSECDELFSDIEKLVTAVDTKSERRSPPVFIINGYGGSGKDTLIDLVDEILTPVAPHRGFVANISPIYPAIKSAIEALKPDMEVMLKYTSMMEDYSPGEIFSKTPQWRTLAHEIKNAWHKVGDGPNVWILSKVISAVTAAERPGAIFIHVREAENIRRLEAALIKMGFATASILIKGRVPESEQPEDRTVLNYDYDIVCDNSSTLDNLWPFAYAIATSIRIAQ